MEDCTNLRYSTPFRPSSGRVSAIEGVCRSVFGTVQHTVRHNRAEPSFIKKLAINTASVHFAIDKIRVVLQAWALIVRILYVTLLMTSRAMGLYNINMAKTEVLRLLLAAFPVISLAVVTIRQAENNGSVVYQQFHVNSDIIARYAYTRINSVVLNSAATSKELSFRVQLPETAFISNFTM